MPRRVGVGGSSGEELRVNGRSKLAAKLVYRQSAASNTEALHYNDHADVFLQDHLRLIPLCSFCDIQALCSSVAGCGMQAT